MSDGLGDFLAKLNGVRKSREGWIARCPGHEDRNASLSVTARDGKILIHCFAGCTIEGICGAIGIKTSDLFPNPQEPPRGRHYSTANSKLNGSVSSRPFKGTEADVERMQCDLMKSRQVRTYIESRGISLRVATDLKWGAAKWKFRNEQNQWVEKAALTIPHYCAGKPVGIKFRSIDGTKLFSQMPGSSTDGLYAIAHLDPKAADVLILEGPEDAALAISHGFNAVGINAAGARPVASDIPTLCQYSRIFLAGDQDPPGQKAMNELQRPLPADRVVRVRMSSYKDIGELWKAAPADFSAKLRRILRFAQGSRDYFEYTDLLDENEISEAEDVEKHAIEKLVPCNAISMLFGEEKSGKSLLSRYFGKSVANGIKVFGKYATQKMPVLCLDLENNAQDIRAFTTYFARLGPERIRYRTRQTGVPLLNSPALLRFCEREHPLIIIDSMTKFLDGADPFHPGEMSIFFDKLLNLCTVGATIILIHHSTRADVDRYANSHQIGANVARAFAVVSEDRPCLNRVRLEGQLFRGGEPVSENLIAFPLISESGMFGLSADSDPFGPDLEKLVAFVTSQPGQACFKETIKKRRGKRAAGNLELLELAIKRGILEVRKDGKVAFPNSGTPCAEEIPFPSQGTDGNGT
jgi:archaellum biogenesis ATPase FlaH